MTQYGHLLGYLVLGALVGCSPDASSAWGAPHAPAAPIGAVAPAPSTLGQRTKTTGCVSQAGLPDPACTPGAIDPRVTQASIASTICARGYTATVRPPVSVTEPIKRQEMAAYGLQGQPLSTTELDHLIALELGGAAADVANLWPQPWGGDGNAHMKDAVENFLNREVCRETIALADAQRMIATDWYAVWKRDSPHLERLST